MYLIYISLITILCAIDSTTSNFTDISFTNNSNSINSISSLILVGDLTISIDNNSFQTTVTEFFSVSGVSKIRLNDTFTGTTGNYDITVTHNNHEHFNNKMNSENNYTRAIMFNNNLELSSTSPWNTNKIEYLSDYDEVEATSSVSLDYSTDTPSIGALPSTDEESWIRYDNSVWENKKHTTFSTVYTNNNSSYSTMRTYKLYT